MEWSNCQTHSSKGDKFYRECGAKLSQSCPEYSAQGLPGGKFCWEFGKNLAGKGATRRRKLRGKVVPIKKQSARRRALMADLIGREMAIEKFPMNGPCRVIALCNQKGGVGKTVTAINLSAIFAASGLRTLLVDVDPQGHSGLGMGLDTYALGRSVYDVMLNGTCPVREAIVPLRPNLDILPSNIDLALAELEFARLKKRERRLREVIDGLREEYGCIVIDCPPSVGILTINALVASQIAIVPVTPSALSLRGLYRVLEISDVLKESISLDAKIFVLLTLFERRQREARLQKRELECAHGEHLLRTVVRKSAKLNEATRRGMSIFEYDQDGPGARDYFDLAREVASIGCGEGGAAEEEMLRQRAFW